MTAPYTLTEPLKQSFEYDDVEAELKRLALDLFDAHIAAELADENVLGMAHRGSLGLIRRMMWQDGIAVLDRNDVNAHNYLYRGWKGLNTGRGMHFLRTFLQLVWPNEWTLDQMCQAKASAYPSELVARRLAEDDPAYYLTSRIYVTIASEANNSAGLARLIPVFRSIIPARLTPRFHVGLGENNQAEITLAGIFTGSTVLIINSILAAGTNTAFSSPRMASIATPWQLLTVKATT